MRDKSIVGELPSVKVGFRTFGGEEYRRLCHGEMDDAERSAYMKKVKDAREEFNRCGELAKAMTDFVNIMGGKKERVAEFCETMAHEHRYLQAEFSSLVYAWLKRQAKQYSDGHYDGRNEHSVKMAYRIFTEVPDAEYHAATYGIKE